MASIVRTTTRGAFVVSGCLSVFLQLPKGGTTSAEGFRAFQKLFRSGRSKKYARLSRPKQTRTGLRLLVARSRVLEFRDRKVMISYSGHAMSKMFAIGFANK